MPNSAVAQNPSLEQRRAALAWNCISPMQQNSDLRDKYYSLIRGFPALVQSVGIAQALAFVMSKAADEQAPRQLRDHLTKWLFSRDCPVPWSQSVENYHSDREGGLMRRLLDETDPEVWWYAEEEAVAFSIWLKRFTEAITPAKKR